ncbi:unnamed protein product [Symbiodinium sp. CCMP2592]|nr:unnamed protein product [Symbiodinium sp. CCMP2592]
METSRKRKRDELLCLPSRSEFIERLQSIRGLTDAHIEKITAGLGMPAIKHDTGLKYEREQGCLRDLLLPAAKGDPIRIPVMSLAASLTEKCQANKAFADILSAAVKTAPDGTLDALVYVDEAVPGNIVQPDNRRKAYLMYISFLQLATTLQAEYSWTTVGCVRHSLVNAAAGGLAGVMCEFVGRLQEELQGFAIQDSTGSPVLVRAQKFWLLADEAALRGTMAAKGSSGVRPCIKCRNACNVGYSIDSLHPITEPDFGVFRRLHVEKLKEYLQHLRQLPNQAQLERAQTLLGWRYVPQSLPCRQPDLIPPQRVLYDGQHCFYVNGIVNVELGLFLDAALEAGALKKTAELADALAKHAWQGQGMRVARLLSSKLLQSGGEYRGKASETMSVLPLVVFFAERVLAPCELLRDNVRSLQLLCRISNYVRFLKQSRDKAAARDMLQLQKKHLELYEKCYGTDKVKPKHHYAMHIPSQLEESHVLADCFPTERRNNLFKQDVAPRMKKLTGFEQAALLRLARTDAQMQTSFSLQPALENPRPDAALALQLGVAKALCSRRLLCSSGAIEAKKTVYILAPTLAVNVRCWVQLNNDCFGLCHKMHTVNDSISRLAQCNSVWTTTEENVLVPCKFILHTCRVSWSLQEGAKVTLLH